MKNSGFMLLVLPIVLAIIGLVMLKENNKFGVIFWVMAVPMFVRGIEAIRKNNKKK